ncbi:restriction endonuclease subunit S [Limosilactobacillus reuteri]|uniref:restriction endonuclease subunit S n=1 Tax=Limosilactobacillus reuteri TaxID=1598 RepID=UPI002072E056|nr:restriction endonuclease subunit S [Limosilactobacillus reuteri]
MDKKPEKLVPEVRFKGFTDDWEQHKLEEIAEFYNGDRGPNYPKPSEIVEQGVPFINAGDLINGHIDYRNCKHITSDKFNQLNGAKLKINDIVYCLRGTIGKNGLVNSDANATIASSLVCIRPVKLRPLFLFQILNSSIEERQRKMVDEGAAQPNISATNLKKFLIPVPNDNEQEKIGEVFSKLNHLITLQQRKLKQLKQLKTAMLQQLFVDKNNKQPNLRFKNFKGDWEQQRLEEVAQVTMGQSPSSRNYTNNPNDYVLVQGNTDLKSNKISPRIWTKEITKQVRKGEFIMTVRAPVGYLAMANMDAVIGRGVAAIDGNKYLYYLLQTKLLDRTWEKLSSGSTFESISSNDIKNLEIKVTENEEEKLIAKLMDTVTFLLNLWQSKIEQLTIFKKYLLQKLFI